MPFRIRRGVYGHGSPSTAMSHCSTASPGCHGTSVYEVGSGTAIMSGSAGLWPIGPAAKPAKPAPPPIRTSSASIGTILAQGLPFMSTNMAKKNSTPSDSALARSSPATSDMGTPRLTRGGCWLRAGTPGQQTMLRGADPACQEPPWRLRIHTRVDVVHLHDTMLRAYAGRAAFGKTHVALGQHWFRAGIRGGRRAATAPWRW